MNMDAATIAQLARAPTTSFDEAVDLIRAFADREASAAVVKAIQDSHRSVTDTLGVLFESPVRRKERV